MSDICWTAFMNWGLYYKFLMHYSYFLLFLFLLFFILCSELNLLVVLVHSCTCLLLYKVKCLWASERICLFVADKLFFPWILFLIILIHVGFVLFWHLIDITVGTDLHLVRLFFVGSVCQCQWIVVRWKWQEKWQHWLARQEEFYTPSLHHRN